MYFLCVAALVLCDRRRRQPAPEPPRSHAHRAAGERGERADLRHRRSCARKLMAFAVSGALAGFAGAIFAHQQRGLNAERFAAQRSVDVFLLAVLGGVSSVGRRAARVALLQPVTNFFDDHQLVARRCSPPAGRSSCSCCSSPPAALISLVNRLRDAVLRIVAQRRQIVVPSLFADYDPEALETPADPAEPRRRGQRPRRPAGGTTAVLVRVGALPRATASGSSDRLGPARETPPRPRRSPPPRRSVQQDLVPTAASADR